jgi:hypothetical protein
MLRRDFLRRLTATAAGLLVADDAMELLAHRKVWAGHSFGYEGVRVGVVKNPLEWPEWYTTIGGSGRALANGWTAIRLPPIGADLTGITFR